MNEGWNMRAQPGWRKGEGLLVWCEEHQRWSIHRVGELKACDLTTKFAHHSGHQQAVQVYICGDATTDVRDAYKRRKKPPIGEVELLSAISREPTSNQTGLRTFLASAIYGRRKG
jgi:hypothetical protein